MKTLKYLISAFLPAVLAIGFVPNSLSQTRQPVQAAEPITATRPIMSISYPEGVTLGVKLKGTTRLPRANGEAKVERKKGMTEIEIELDEMKPATLFGSDFATYVLWTVPPEGQVKNVGEFVVSGNRSKLNAATPLQTFAMAITAEPHFLVDSPSKFVVLETTRPTERISGQMIQTSTIRYRGFEGRYNFERESLLNMPESEGEMRSDLKQAEIAVRLAERAQAEKFAADELAKAREALRQTLPAPLGAQCL